MTAREPRPALTHQGLVAFGQGLNELNQVGSRGSLLDLRLAGAWFSAGDILSDANREQVSVLSHEPHLLTGGGELPVVQVLPIQEHPLILNRIKTKQHLDQGGFTTAAGPHDGDLFTRMNFQVDAL